MNGGIACTYCSLHLSKIVLTSVSLEHEFLLRVHLTQLVYFRVLWPTAGHEFLHVLFRAAAFDYFIDLVFRKDICSHLIILAFFDI